MEFKINRESVPVTEALPELQQEHDFSQSIVLPDYEPEIFRVISCEAVPFITDYRCTGGRLTYELCIRIRVMYCGERADSLYSVSQNVSVSKTIDIPELPEDKNFEIRLCPETEYQTCRAAGKRRLDVRGAVNVRIKVFVQREQKVVCGCMDEECSSSGIQLRSENINIIKAVRRASRNISLSENISVTPGRPVISVLRCSAMVSDVGCSVIAGKLVVRGELVADILMKTGTEEESTTQNMRATLCPFSQIIDADGIDESFNGIAEADITSFEAKPSSDNSGTIACSAELRLICTASKTGTSSVVTDAYSTKYKCSCNAEELRISAEPAALDKSFVLSCDIRSGDESPRSVSDICCKLRNVSIEPLPTQGKLRVTGMMGVGVLASCDENGMTLTEREEAFEELVSIGTSADAMEIFAFAEPGECSYHLGADGSLSVKCSVKLVGTIYPESRIQAITDIQLDTESLNTVDRECALRIYYGKAGESIWEIAKRAGTRTDAIISENDLEGDYLKKPGMLLIPVVH